jgi:hypothetical protein
MSKKQEWVTAKTIASTYSVTPRHIHNLRGSVLKQGVHWRKVSSPKVMRPSYRFDLEKTIAALEKYWK